MENNLSYPIGKFEPKPFSKEQKEEWIAAIRFLPERLEMALHNLDAVQLRTPYRPNAWTIQQLAHHIADSHMNGYIRTKLALTEDVPTIKPYDQDAWVTTADIDLPFNLATTILQAIHKKWASIFESLDDATFNKTFNHPDDGEVTLWKQLGLYAWHGLHHVTQINDCRERNGWR